MVGCEALAEVSWQTQPQDEWLVDSNRRPDLGVPEWLPQAITQGRPATWSAKRTEARRIKPRAKRVETRRAKPHAATYGVASWYGPGFNGRRTASGARFDQNKLTAAHRTLPFGTRVRVTDVKTGRSVEVRINDRGPFSHDRIIDLSRGAASRIGLVRRGLGSVRLEVL